MDVLRSTVKHLHQILRQKTEQVLAHEKTIQHQNNHIEELTEANLQMAKHMAALQEELTLIKQSQQSERSSPILGSNQEQEIESERNTSHLVSVTIDPHEMDENYDVVSQANNDQQVYVSENLHSTSIKEHQPY